MHHSYLDKYARQNSPLHRLDARVKTLLAMASVILIASNANAGLFFFAVLLFLIAALCAVGNIPFHYLFVRSAVIIPFSLFAALTLAFSTQFGGTLWEGAGFALTAQGLNRGAALILRSFAAVSLMILLINTTPFDQLLKTLRWLQVPGALILLLSFFYRYLYLLWDERERMQRARDLRYFGGRWLQQLSLAGNLAASLFLRSYERAERVQKAMLSRGWDGTIRPLKIGGYGRKDLFALLIGLITFVLLWLIRHH